MIGSGKTTTAGHLRQAHGARPAARLAGRPAGHPRRRPPLDLVHSCWLRQYGPGGGNPLLRRCPHAGIHGPGGFIDELRRTRPVTTRRDVRRAHLRRVDPRGSRGRLDGPDRPGPDPRVPLRPGGALDLDPRSASPLPPRRGCPGIRPGPVRPAQRAAVLRAPIRAGRPARVPDLDDQAGPWRVHNPPADRRDRHRRLHPRGGRHLAARPGGSATAGESGLITGGRHQGPFGIR